jgi:hypothetical protein
MSRLSDGSEANEVVHRHNDPRESEIRRGLLLLARAEFFSRRSRARVSAIVDIFFR